jgi:hypothetical protein
MDNIITLICLSLLQTHMKLRISIYQSTGGFIRTSPSLIWESTVSSISFPFFPFVYLRFQFLPLQASIKVKLVVNKDIN